MALSVVDGPSVLKGGQGALGQGEYVKLNIVYNLTAVNGDIVQSTNPTETVMCIGAEFYVPAEGGAERTPLYRMYKSSMSDHMVSTNSGEGGYATEGVLGYPWTSLALAPNRLIRNYCSSPYDHALQVNSDIWPNYTKEPLGAYGYRRYEQDRTLFSTVSAGGVTVTSNLVAGGTLWSWKYRDVEYVNSFDFGRQIQCSFAPGLSPDTTLSNPDGSNPTEGGDIYCHTSATTPTPQTFHGSPCIQATVSPGVSPIQRTRAVPLDWHPERFGGGPSNPVVWRQLEIGKELTLNFMGLGAVAKYTTIVKTPNPIEPCAIEIPTGYMPEIFTRAYFYYADTATIVGPYESSLLTTAVGRLPKYGGVIVCTEDEVNAMGVYGVSTTVTESPAGSLAPGGGVSVRRFGRNAGDGTKPSSPELYATTKWTAHWNGSLPAGESRFNVYLITGTVAEVKSMMGVLYANRATVY